MVEHVTPFSFGTESSLLLSPLMDFCVKEAFLIVITLFCLVMIVLTKGDEEGEVVSTEEELKEAAEGEQAASEEESEEKEEEVSRIMIEAGVEESVVEISVVSECSDEDALLTSLSSLLCTSTFSSSTSSSSSSATSARIDSVLSVTRSSFFARLSLSNESSEASSSRS